MRRFVLFAALVLGIAAVYLFWSRGHRSAEGASAQRPLSSEIPTRDAVQNNSGGTSSTSRSRGTSTAAAPGGTAAGIPFDEADFPIAAPLNAPGSTIGRDLDILSQVFDAWRSNFPTEGNPVGENADITAALMGDNRLGFALIPKGHRAVNERGELCDRWGTPFRFHQLSGSHMEIRSAGPDRKFATGDDAVFTPQ